MQAPQGRYRIVERGRRLVTIDTQTGIEIDMLPSSSSRDLRGAVRTSTPSPSSLAGSGQVSSDQPDAPSAIDGRMNGPGLDKSGRVAILLVGGLVVIVFLIASGAWIPVTIGLLFPPVRAIVFVAAKTAVTRFLNGGGPV